MPQQQMITDEKAGFITRVEELAYELKIEEVMTRNPETVNPRVQMKELLELLELSAVIITEGAMPDPDTLAKANDEGITLQSTTEFTYPVVGKLWEMGLRAG